MNGLEKTKYALEQMQNFEQSFALLSSEVRDAYHLTIRAYATRYLTVLFYSEMEKCVEEILQERLGLINDSKISIFLQKTNSGMLKRVNKSDLRKTVALFGSPALEMFDQLLQEKMKRN